jgi:hypothetical protein
MNIIKAKYVYDVDSPLSADCIEITRAKFTPGIGYQNKMDYIYSAPRGDWTEIKFRPNENVSYSNFLNTMVFKNLEVSRKLAKLELERVLDLNVYDINLLNAIRILDPTFIPPVINTKCQWQNDLLTDIITKSSICVISTCRNRYRLERYFNALRALPKQV